MNDTACAAPLQQVRALLAGGRAGEALALARDVFAGAELPAAQLGELCALSAAAAQASGLAGMAEQMWRQAIAQAASPADAADALIELAALLAGQRRAAEAQACLRDALALAPRHGAALVNLALLLTDSGELAEAEEHLRTALALAPDDAQVHTNLGLLLARSKRFDEAEQHQRRALALQPDAPEIRSNLGNLLAARGGVAEAESMLRAAIDLDPSLAAAHNNLAVLLADQHRDDEAEAAFRHALALRPGYPLARLGLSVLLLARGRFEEGWALHEARRDPGLPDHPIAAPPLELPEWQGEPLAGKAVLIWPEQGLGDQIQFSRFAGRLKALGAARVTLVCQRPLLALFASLRGVDRVIGAEVVDNAFSIDADALGAHDLWTLPLGIPRWLHTDLTTLPEVAMPYLRSGAQSAQRRDSPLRVGLVWRGNPRHDNDADRSLPGLDALAPLWSVPGIEFVSLQTGSAGLAALTPPPDQPLRHIGGELRDFAATAAALEGIDLLICVDTSIAHLAGALGRPCWLLLPQHRTDWRWLRERDDSPWYPLGMRLFRQTRRGDWASVIERVRDALAERAAHAR